MSKNPSDYFGGGTPTQIDPSLIGEVLRRPIAFGMRQDAEVTVEATPAVDGEKFSQLRSVGCNRLSLGVQSLIIRP